MLKICCFFPLWSPFLHHPPKMYVCLVWDCQVTFSKGFEILSLVISLVVPLYWELFAPSAVVDTCCQCVTCFPNTPALPSSACLFAQSKSVWEGERLGHRGVSEKKSMLLHSYSKLLVKQSQSMKYSKHTENNTQWRWEPLSPHLKWEKLLSFFRLLNSYEY